MQPTRNPEAALVTQVRYLGAIVVDPDGSLRLEQPRITPPPVPPVDHPVRVPRSVSRAIAGGRGFLARILGDSMQPGILDNDVGVVVHRAPKNGDVVVVRATEPHPVYGAITACVWRYHQKCRDSLLTKDNTVYRTQRPVTPEEIMGVVTIVLPRERRNELENYARILEFHAIDRALGRCPSTDLGFYTPAKRDAFRAIVTIPESELIGHRLPWGYFRALAKADHLHVGIHAGDSLTIDATPDTHVGQRVIDQNENGTITIGVLQRERLHEQRPGEFYIEVGDHRVYVSEDNGRMPTGHTLGVIEHHELPDGCAGRRHRDRGVPRAPRP
jgi:SOS-response transcriptional repressor LexA